MRLGRRFIVLVAWWLLTSYPAYSQNSATHDKVYSLKAADGSVYILAENHGTMPFTVFIRAKLEHMRSSEPLPLRLVVVPNDKTYVLTIFKPDGTGTPTWHYTAHSSLGVHTGHPPDTSYVYQLPYSLPNNLILPQKATKKEIAPIGLTKYLYKFTLPSNTPICAARAGKVEIIKQETEKSRTINANIIYVLHQDGSYGCYCNIRPHSVLGGLGRQVAVGDTLGYFDGNKRNPFFWFAVQYQGDSTTISVPASFRVGSQVNRPH